MNPCRRIERSKNVIETREVHSHAGPLVAVVVDKDLVGGRCHRDLDLDLRMLRVVRGPRRRLNLATGTPMTSLPAVPLEDRLSVIGPLNPHGNSTIEIGNAFTDD